MLKKTCIDCNKKIGLTEKYVDGKILKEIWSNYPFNDSQIDSMGNSECLCVPCAEKIDFRHSLDIYNFKKSILSDEDFQNMVNDPQNFDMIEEAKRQMEEQPEPVQTVPTTSTGGAMPSKFTVTNPSSYQPPEGYRPPGIQSPSGYQSTKTNSTSQTMSASQLRTLTQTLHNQYKADWDKNGIVQFKNNEIAILKRVWGQQVQFIVAYSQVTKEGYRLMAIDEGMEAQGSGFTGGASAYFYFQKMEFVR